VKHGVQSGGDGLMGWGNNLSLLQAENHLPPGKKSLSSKVIPFKNSIFFFLTWV